ncbi:MAG: peptidase C11 [Lachnospiraceae bacterium]|nr:peptidase C11 [Lachnospiraceae bacterium]
MNDHGLRGREKHTSAGSGRVAKKGSGLGTGQVGNVSSHSNTGGGMHLSGGGTGSGIKRGGGISLLAIVIAVVFYLLQGGSGGSTNVGSIDLGGSSDTGYQTTYQNSYSDTSADMTVDPSARAKQTVIRGDGTDTVTIMVYMCGTDLESKYGMGTNDINEMLDARLNDKVNIIIYTGGCKNWKNNVISSTYNQIYKISNGQLICLEENAGNNTMTDPSNLAGFIRYCNNNYPANRNELILWDHGGGSITGYGYDEKNAGSGSMTLAGIDSALSSAGVQFDFIGFDACLMATVENGLMLEKYGDYMIASEETEPGVGWYYTNWLTSLASDTSMPTVEIGKNIVDSFVEECDRKCRGQQTTLSIVDLAELKATVPEELTDFALSTKEMINNNGYKTVAKARRNTREFARSSKIDQIDMVHFCENINTAEARDLAKAIEGAVKYNRTASSMTDAHGLAIYFPYQKTGKTSTAINLFNKIGMDSEYSKCIREFAATETTGQVAAGGSSSPYSSLAGSLIGGGSMSESSGGSSDLIMSMLSGMLTGSQSGGGSNSMGLDSSVLGLFTGREISDEDTAEYVSANYLDANNLVWDDSTGTPLLSMDDSQWDLVQELELNVFVDDGEGYIDLGMDNVFDFDDNGALIGEYDGTWLAINGQIVPYYHMDTVDNGSEYSINGYVPCLLNGERSELLLRFDSDNPEGYIVGARSVYASGETDAVAKNVTEINSGDVMEPLCDYYSYSGEYQDSYMMDEVITLNGNDKISNVAIEASSVRATFRLTDIYNQSYWTPVIP